MKVLVVYASRCGATQGIAQRIGATLRGEGLEAVVMPADRADRAEGYDSVVVGSAAYFFRWMKAAKNYVQRNREALAGRPVWLFSSGPLGNKPTDDQGRNLRETTVPKEIAELTGAIHPREHHVFFGAMDHSKLGFLFRLLLKMPANENDAIFPQGDFRNWEEIEGWAGGIARELKAGQTAG